MRIARGTVGQIGARVVEQAVIIADYPATGQTEIHRHQEQAGPHAVSSERQRVTVMSQGIIVVLVVFLILLELSL